MKLLPNRFTALAAAGLFLASLAWLALDPRVPRAAFEEYSIYNTSPKGLSLAYRYLASTGRTTSVMTRSSSRSVLVPGGVIFRVRPEQPGFRWPVQDTKSIGLKPRDAWEFGEDARYPFSPEEEEWVREGGRLVLAIDRPYHSLQVEATDPAAPAKDFPVWPGVERLEAPTARALSGEARRLGLTVFESGGKPVVVRQRRGKGEIVLTSLPEIFQNESIGKGDHLALLDRLADRGRPVVFDEYVHGMQSEVGVLEILRQWGFGPFVLLLFLAALASFWRRRVRVGPEEDDARETRVEAVDFVDSLSLLYRKMLPRRLTLVLYARAFEKSVSAHTGLRDAALQERVRQYLPARASRPAAGKDLSAQEFQNELDLINLAFRRLNDAKRPGNRRASPTGARPA